MVLVTVKNQHTPGTRMRARPIIIIIIILSFAIAPFPYNMLKGASQYIVNGQMLVSIQLFIFIF